MTTKINKTSIGQSIELNGWVSKSRRLGNLIFVDLRDSDGILQLVIDQTNDNYELANSLRSEFVISITGKVIERKEPNTKIYSGEVEVEVKTLKIISKAQTTPLIIAEETDAGEQTRMEYKYLDIRRPNQANIIKFRSDFNKIIRTFMDTQDFTEVETPIITKPTPGGAAEFQVLSNNHEGEYYSLVQSPQIYKQLLMYGGVDKYYQLAKCFRDEAGRKDRQIEFTQLDIEQAFVSPETIQTMVESLLSELFQKMLDKKIEVPFVRLSHEQAMDKYGSDKPHLGFGNELVDVTTAFEDTDLNFVKDAVVKGSIVKSIFFEQSLSRKQVDKFDTQVKEQGGNGLAWVRVEDSKISSGSIKEQSLSVEKLIELSGLTTFTFLMIVGEKSQAEELLGRVRLAVAKELDLIDSSTFNFAWVTDFPMFIKENGKIQSAHNPFSAPQDPQSLMDSTANSYDIVLNGFEIGGGSLRITDPELQIEIFKILGMSDEEIKESFSWLLEAMGYGTPNHGGIALGLDRILAVMLNTESIRDVIAFPKSTLGTDEMLKAPIKLK